MPDFAEPLAGLVRELKRLPGIGQKSAQRIAFHLMRAPREDAERLAAAVMDVKDKLGLCAVCNNISAGDLCPYCGDPHRDRSTICVVEEPSDVLALESAHEFKGRYHVLHGLVSPINGIGPEDIKLKELLERLHAPVKEVLIALSPSVEGDVTAQYISKLVCESGLPVCLSRLASGIPMGGEIKYMDQVTIASAIRYRRTIRENP